MILFVFFVLPLSTILLSIVLEKILHSPTLVAITFLAIYLVAIFALNLSNIITNLGEGIIAVIIYTIIAYITAWTVRIVRFISERFFNNCSICEDTENINNEFNNINTNNDLLSINCTCNNGNSQNLLRINSNCMGADDNNGNCNCRYENNNDFITENFTEQNVNQNRGNIIRGRIWQKLL